MKEKLNVNEDCSNMNNLPNIKIILPYRKDYYSKERITYNKKKVENLNKEVTTNEEIASLFNNNISSNDKDKTNINKDDNDIFGKFEIELTPEDYILDGKKIKSNNFLDGSQCHPAFMALNVPAPRGPLFVFGEYFLRKFYTVFDRDREVIGFALSKDEKEKTDVIIKTPYDDLEEISNLKQKVKEELTNSGINKDKNNSKFDSILENIEKQIKSLENDMNNNNKDKNQNNVKEISENVMNVNKDDSFSSSKGTENYNENKKYINDDKKISTPKKDSTDISNFENFLEDLDIRTSSFLDKDLNLDLI